jgi:hypothetical protein
MQRMKENFYCDAEKENNKSVEDAVEEKESERGSKTLFTLNF